MRIKKVFRFGLFFLLVLVVTEVITRKLGFINQPLFREDKDFEFIPLPNQQTRLYGSRFATNEFSMRSEPLEPSDTTTVLLLGDSVIFGRFRYDNDSLASSILEKMLTLHFKKRIRVLNISVPSWSPDNNFAYLKRYGTFHAKEIILVANSLDGIEKMTFAPNFGKMGGLGGFKKKNYYFGIQALIEKAIIKTGALLNTAKEEPPMPPMGKELNPGFAGIDSICNSRGIRMTVYLHSMGTEISSKKYSEGGEEIIKFCKERNIQLIEGIGAETESLYEDKGHLTYAGQRFLANQLFPVVVQNLNSKILNDTAK